MKAEKEIIEKINELKQEVESINKALEKYTDYDVWKSLDQDLNECNLKIEMLEWII